MEHPTECDEEVSNTMYKIDSIIWDTEKVIKLNK